MNFLKNPTVIIVLLGLVFGGGLYFYNSYQTKQKAAQDAAKQVETAKTATTTTVANLTNADPADFAAEIKTEQDLADIKAKAYNPNEALAAIEITIPGNLVPRSGNATYIYDQPKDAANHYTVSIAQATQNFIRAVIPKEDYFGQITPVNPKSYKLKYIEALKVAEKNGGKDFRGKNTLTELKLTLKNADPKGWLYWFVHYSSDKSAFEAQVDAFTGRFVSPSEAAAAKAATTPAITTDQSTTTP